MLAKIDQFNDFLAVKITKGVGTMWCAYAFTALSCISLPEAIASHNAVVLVSWIAQTFLQLVLLSILMVGQLVLDRKHNETQAQLADTHKLINELHKKQDRLHRHLGIDPRNHDVEIR